MDGAPEKDGTWPIKKKNKKRKPLTAAEAQRKCKVGAGPHVPWTAADLPSLQSLVQFPKENPIISRFCVLPCPGSF